ncbi:Aurovertin biosynthesis cluster transcription factor aurF [Metarhizium anisopliae]
MCSTASLPQPAPNAESPAPSNADSVNEAGQTIQRDADNSIQDAATPGLVTVAKACVRSDFVQFLETNLSRWCQHGLWGRERSSGHMARVDKYEKLQTAYSYICQLDARMKDDAIRSRMAMVFLHLEFEKTCRECRSSHPGEAKTKTMMGRGRGKISSMIDGILENTHPSWRFADAREKGEMRTNFHNQKRYGKRWWTLVNTLGCGILLLCSSSLVGMMYAFPPTLFLVQSRNWTDYEHSRNTTVTATTLAAIARVIQVVHSDMMSILNLANPIAEKLFQNHGYQDYDTKQFLEKLQAFGSISVGQARANGGNAGDEWRQ